MGTILPCFRGKEKGEIKNIDEKMTASFNNFINISKGEFYCPDCAKGSNETPEIVEILKIHSDSGKIDIRCQKNEKVEQYTMEEYVEKLKENNINKCGKANNCLNKDGKQEEIQYCTKCKKIFCKNCFDQTDLIDLSNQKKCGFCSCSNEKKECIHIHIDQKDFSTKCQKHGLKTDECCRECEKYVCKKCFDEYHKRHNNTKIKEEKIEKAKKKIIEKYKNLEQMKKFYKLVQSSYEKNNTNNIYKRNIITVAECINNEQKRDNYDIDLALYKLRQMNKGIVINY